MPPILFLRLFRHQSGKRRIPPLMIWACFLFSFFFSACRPKVLRSGIDDSCFSGWRHDCPGTRSGSKDLTHSIRRPQPSSRAAEHRKLRTKPILPPAFLFLPPVTAEFLKFHSHRVIEAEIFLSGNCSASLEECPFPFFFFFFFFLFFPETIGNPQ